MRDLSLDSFLKANKQPRSQHSELLSNPNRVQGSLDRELYTLRHWELVDIFVYFSHHRITIPPPCWTNAAHRNGVKVLGTFITEWDDGLRDTLHLLDSCETDATGHKIFTYVEKLGEKLSSSFLSFGFFHLIHLPLFLFSLALQSKLPSTTNLTAG